MTSNEILQANLLDILFDNRNKQYGAYTLRKYYAHRMGIALGIMISMVLLLLFFIHPDYDSSMAGEEKRTTIVLEKFNIPQPIVPEVQRIEPPVRPSRESVAEVQHTSHLIMVENTTNSLPDLRYVDGRIGDDNLDGPANGHVSPELPNHPATNGGGTGTGTESVKEPEGVGPTKAPEFPGGVEAWMRFLNKHLNTPSELEAGDTRTVHIRFTVSTDGAITAFEIMRSGGNAFDNEVIRVLKKMPKWQPALQNGKPITVQFTQPVTFVSEEE